MRSCRIGMAIGQRLDLPRADLSDLLYTLLLKDLGCGSKAARICALYLTDDHRVKRAFKKVDGSHLRLLGFARDNVGVHTGMAGRFNLVVRRLLDSADASRTLIETRSQRDAAIALSLGFSNQVAEGIRNLDEKWDGRDLPKGRTHEEIPLLSRIALVAQICDIFRTDGIRDVARSEVLSRAGTWFDPDVTAVFDSVSRDPAFWEALGSPDLQQDILALEPARERGFVDEAYLDDVADAFAQVIDAGSPYTAGHSVRVALLAGAIAAQLGYSRPKRRRLPGARRQKRLASRGRNLLPRDRMSREMIDGVTQSPPRGSAAAGRRAMPASACQPVARVSRRLL